MTFSESKALILQNLRSARVEKKSVPKSVEPLHFSNQLSFDSIQLQNNFKVNFEAVSGEVHILGEEENLAEKVDELLEELGADSVSFWNMELLKPLKIPAETSPSTADAGITGADFAVADTGTLILLSEPKQPRLTSILPPVHIAILRKETIVPDIHFLFVKLGETYGNYEELCSCISFITGPSRTADIELDLTLGVHGPKRTVVVII